MGNPVADCLEDLCLEFRPSGVFTAEPRTCGGGTNRTHLAHTSLRVLQRLVAIPSMASARQTAGTAVKTSPTRPEASDTHNNTAPTTKDNETNPETTANRPTASM